MVKPSQAVDRSPQLQANHWWFSAALRYSCGFQVCSEHVTVEIPTLEQQQNDRRSAPWLPGLNCLSKILLIRLKYLFEI